MKKAIALLIIAAAACSSASEHGSFTDLEPARKTMDEAMALFVKSDIEGGFGKLRNYWPLPSGEIDTVIEKSVEQRKRIAFRFGDSLGYELVRQQRLGDSLVRYVYIEKFERSALRWNFVLYKPADSWTFDSISWDDNLQALFDLQP